MYDQVLMVDARTYDRTGYLTSTTRYTVIDNQSLAEEIAEDLAFECMDELNEEVRNSDLDDFMNEEYTEADMHKRYVGDEDFPELKYITIADKDVPDFMRVVVEITPSTLIKTGWWVMTTREEPRWTFLLGMAFALAVLFGNLHRIIIAAAWAYSKIKDANRKG